jgi:hypothetical protein
MTITLRKTLFAMATMIVLLGAIQPSILSAQTSGVGSDGYTRFMWTGTDDRISIWRLNPILGGAISHQYGPFDGYAPLALTVGSNNYTYVLWKRTDGAISLWLVDPNLNAVTSRVYGPIFGWVPVSLSVSEDGFNRLRVIWRETRGYVSIWSLDANLNLLSTQIYGPFFGFDPSAANVRPAESESEANAISAMAHPKVSAPIPLSGAGSN